MNNDLIALLKSNNVNERVNAINKLGQEKSKKAPILSIINIIYTKAAFTLFVMH